MTTNAQEHEFLTVDELAREWRQHRATIYRKVSNGEIPSIRLGGESAALRIPRSALEKVYEESAVGHGSSAEQAVGDDSSVDAGDSVGPRSQSLAARVQDPEPSAGSRAWMKRAGEER